jgi:hypothetical protein
MVVAAGAVLMKSFRQGQVAADDRAYSIDSGQLTLAEGLRRANIQLPECLTKHLRYALVDNGFGYYYDVYLQLEAPPACMEELIQTNKLYGFVSQQLRLEDATHDRKLPVRDLWLDRVEVSRIGWEVGPDQAFQEFVGATTPKERVHLLVQHTHDPALVRAYLYASHGG